MKNLISIFSKFILLVGIVILIALSGGNQRAFAQKSGQILGTVTDPRWCGSSKCHHHSQESWYQCCTHSNNGQ